MVGFHFHGQDDGLAIYCNESEIVAFSRFQRRALSIGAGYPELTGSAAGVRRSWESSVAVAIKAGQSIKLAECPGYKLIGGER
jgi:cobyrinic acid a,c-diamide synthase